MIINLCVQYPTWIILTEWKQIKLSCFQFIRNKWLFIFIKSITFNIPLYFWSMFIFIMFHSCVDRSRVNIFDIVCIDSLAVLIPTPAMHLTFHIDTTGVCVPKCCVLNDVCVPFVLSRLGLLIPTPAFCTIDSFFHALAVFKKKPVSGTHLQHAKTLLS